MKVTPVQHIINNPNRPKPEPQTYTRRLLPKWGPEKQEIFGKDLNKGKLVDILA